MTRTFLIIIFQILIYAKSYAAYFATTLPKLIEKSKIIVYAQIISVNNENFTIVTKKRVKYTYRSDTLTIQKFKNWTCAARYTEYAPGQEAVFFIELNKNNQLQVMGAGNEGEMVVKSDTAYVIDYNQKIFPSAKFEFLSRNSKFIQVNIRTLIEGIKIYLENLDIINKELKNEEPGTIVYQYSTIDKLPKNYFLDIIIDQKQRGYF